MTAHKLQFLTLSHFCHPMQVTAARDLLQQQLKETQASLASSKAAAPPNQAPAAITVSPFAQCSGVPLELQSLCAELKAENARLLLM